MNKVDQELLLRWTEQRNAEAFHQLTARYSGMVFATCARIVGNAADAEEVAQECFEKLSLVGKSPGGYLGPWLHRVATNRSLQFIRGENRRRAREISYAEKSDT